MTPLRATDASWSDFHPAVAAWLSRAFPRPTPAQAQAWPLIRAGRSTLIAAPTGSGKTLTAFMAAIDELVRAALASDDGLPDTTTVVYVSPLKALSNDIQVNLETPLAGIGRALADMGLRDPGIRTAVRTGDTPQSARQAMRKRPPHILVTTPESLYVLLGSDSGRAMLAHVRTVIVDEIHAVAASKRGSHLALSLARLDALCHRAPTRVGLSATQKPLDAVARFLVGTGRDCAIVDVGHVRDRDLAIELPPVPLEAVMPNEVWERVYDRMAELTVMHRTTLVFVNTRRMAERLARHLADRLGPEGVAAHHGSLAKEYRLDAEQRLKRGDLRVLVATASLELGIDIGDVELVCQVGSPRSIAAFLQRVGRSGHHVGGTPKGRLFPTSRDDLLECTALLDCIRRDELDLLRIPVAPLDVLAQHIVAEVASREWHEDALFGCVRAAAPFAALPREKFDGVLRMLAEGHTGRNGVRGSYIHRDSVSGMVRGKRNGKLTAVTSGGTIPDNADFTVLMEPQGLTVGTVNEDFAVESLAGDVFQLGNTAYRILKIEGGKVRVEDAQGAAPNIPFWLGEAPGRSDALSAGVSRLLETLDQCLAADRDTAMAWLVDEVGTGEPAALQIVDYLSRTRAALGALPSQNTLIMERFFDETGGTQLVLHLPFGSRVNRAWGLALRKRFCRKFNVELQAAATEDAVVLSLSQSHSFALDDVWRYLHANSAERVLIQAVLDAPMFNLRWRWNATTALALPRYAGGRKVAPQLQRMKSDDLLAAVFPDQAACLENVVGERELPDHPLVEQTLDDCLHDAMDSTTWLAILRRIDAGDVRLIARDLTAPSPLAMEILNARPYAFLDDAPLEERRTQAVANRRWRTADSADDLGALNADAIASVADEAWPQVRDTDELHEALMGLAAITVDEASVAPEWLDGLQQLAEQRRATRVGDLWVAIERVPLWQALRPDTPMTPALTVPASHRAPWTRDNARIEVLRARLTGFGPQTVTAIAQPLGLSDAEVTTALQRLEVDGYVMRGRFTPGAHDEEWCERHLLARIHRYTIRHLRREIEPVTLQDFMRFLFDWQHVNPAARLQGADTLPLVVAQLEGYEAPAGAWEAQLLRTRVTDYAEPWLDDLCRAGKVIWTRLGRQARSGTGPVRATPIALLPRRHLAPWQALPTRGDAPAITPRAQRVFDVLTREGALFFDEILDAVPMLGTELEEALGELVALGWINTDSFAGLRALILPAGKRSRPGKFRRRGGSPAPSIDDAGRWAVVRRPLSGDDGVAAAVSNRRPATDPKALEHIVHVLLRRYGVVFWRMLAREPDWLPPWRELLPVLHRLEARGEIRGGRFVAGLSGEQFALPEAIPLLRDIRRQPKDDSFVRVSGVDPLNLIGTLLPGDKVPALTANRLVYLDGVPVGTLVADDVRMLMPLAPEQLQRARELLLGLR
ncbi:DEAD/DEAH box helicase [Alcaligenaceae bacterium A4P071]|nr:DEAD/DEAH box helicase [Alcaligenaceae bacterium A4P071]